MLKPRYPAHDMLIAPAREGQKSGWHLAGGCGVIIVLGYMLTALTFQSILTWAYGAGLAGFEDDIFSGSTPLAMFVLLLSFGVWPLAIWTALQMVHNRPLRPAFGPEVVLDFLIVLKALVLLNLVVFVLPPWGIPLPEGQYMTPGLPFQTWAILLPLSLLAVLVQVSAEELLFRGYLQQQLAAWWNTPLVWMVIPSALFGLAHYDASAGSNAWLIALWAFMFGLLMADLTARTGSLGPAIAVHFANNVLAMLFVGVPDSMSGLALYLYPAGIDDELMVRGLLPLDFALMIAAWLAARLALRR